MSACGTYRYQLVREWSAGNLLPFVMLNPSTADANSDDPTIRRCIGFAKREGATGIVVYNLYAFRATSPADIKTAANPYGPDNDGWLMNLSRWAGDNGKSIVCAWGTNASENAVKRATKIFATFGAMTACLGKTKDGHPKHPLYVRGDAPLVPFP